ncbi:YbdK family carboxylate-amine ligase [Cryobacterium sp. 1639]|uniref:carboxylate-amine ligase n=1 Tax=Cryobacterium inferilacus TaxID=2866629 RepID=UPI001C72D664|nr:YbdK family carboxylate-amine ligase [Cryobacterium sp. 1639]MBX0299603.1 YbdK family carboxylate-amine ligase [Cryobacterium sp. 1639]
MATFGIEEEFQFLDPETLRPVDAGATVFETLSATTDWREVTHREFLASQIEHASAVFEQIDDAHVALTGFRRLVAAHAAELGVVVASIGTPPDTTAFPSITDTERYHRIVRTMDAVIADHQVSGLHVHVGIPNREAGVIVLNAVRPWLPLLTAIASNSPLWRGQDTGHDSWRTVLLRRWTTSGCPPAFVDAADYDRRIARLLGIGGTVDLGVIMWDVRLSEHLPTIEFRMADAQLDARSTLFIAALCRALVAHSLGVPGAQSAAARASAEMPSELLSAALLHSAHYGMRQEVFDPIIGALVPAHACLARLLRMLAPELGQLADLEMATEAVARLAVDGTGAQQQRAAFSRSGLPGLRRLLSASVTAATVTAAAVNPATVSPPRGDAKVAAVVGSTVG